MVFRYRSAQINANLNARLNSLLLSNALVNSTFCSVYSTSCHTILEVPTNYSSCCWCTLFVLSRPWAKGGVLTNRFSLKATGTQSGPSFSSFMIEMKACTWPSRLGSTLFSCKPQDWCSAYLPANLWLNIFCISLPASALIGTSLSVSYSHYLEYSLSIYIDCFFTHGLIECPMMIIFLIFCRMWL